MAISRKRAPVTQDSELNRVFSRIYDDMNELINAVNQGGTSEKKKTFEGKTGDLRIVKDANRKYFLEARTDEGWIRNVDSVSLTGGAEVVDVGFKFREKD